MMNKTIIIVPFFILSVLFVVAAAAVNKSSRILFLTPVTSPSHSTFFRPVVEALAERGHSVTYWNGLKQAGSSNGISNPVKHLYSDAVGKLNVDHNVQFDDRDHPFRLLFTFYDRTVAACSALYDDPIFHRLMAISDAAAAAADQQHFDLIIVDGVLNECVLPLVHRFQSPLIYMNGFQVSPWLLDAVGAPLASDHYPNPAFSFPERMNLWQRTLNALSNIFIIYYRNWFIMSTVDRFYDRYLQQEIKGNNNGSISATNPSLLSMPSVRDIEQRHLSLVIANTHFSLNYQHPKVAAMIEADALHCRPSKPLPKELEDYVAASSGFIIVSFGSILRGANLPESVRRLFLAVFARLDQRIIWKWEDQLLLPDVSIPTNFSIPTNVKLVPWLPQQDLLGHPKCRLFITHCGLLSKQESVYHSVPFIALPVFADQPLNAQKAQDDGYAIHLNWDTLSEQVLYDAIQRILSDKTFSDNVRKTSQLMRDQKERPLDRAVYWIEYVIRHKGAHHLRSPSRQMYLYERSLIDVALFLILICIVSVYLSRRIISAAVAAFQFFPTVKIVASPSPVLEVVNLKNKNKKNL